MRWHAAPVSLEARRRREDLASKRLTKGWAGLACELAQGGQLGVGVLTPVGTLS